MKKLALHCSLVAICLVFPAAATQAATIALWTFETNPPATAGPFAADDGLGTGDRPPCGRHDDLFEPERKWLARILEFEQVGNWRLLPIPSLHAWRQRRRVLVGPIASSAGPGAANVVDPNFRLQYSTDGTNFTNVVDYLVPVATWDSTLPTTPQSLLRT